MTSSDAIMDACRKGFTFNGVTQKFCPIYCYLDIPITNIIRNIESREKRNITFELLTKRSPVIIDWIKSETKKGFLRLHDFEYIDFLEEHAKTVRNFIRVALGDFEGALVEHNGEIFAALDQDYIEMYDSFTEYYKLNKVEIPLNTDLRSLPTTKERAMLKSPEYQDESIKVIFAQSSFPLKS
jgi:hypothetical protein